MPNDRKAAVWLHGQRIGEISARSRTEIRFVYDQEVLRSNALNTPLLSCSLPTRDSRTNARPFFAGLLPEGDARRELASRAGRLVTDVHGLLTRYGQDVAGAVVVGDRVAERPRAHAEPYTADGLMAEVAALDDRSGPLALHDDSELSIAGVQDKMLLVSSAEGWARPVHGYPSTHILKLDDRSHPGLVVAEHTCLLVARAAGLPAAVTQLDRIGELDVLIVARFDRSSDDQGHPVRLHQEDACQALGVDLEQRPHAKYESDGGPRLSQVSELLRAWGREDDLNRLLDQVVFTVVSGNADAHGKNISFLHPEPDRIQLAPLYDTVPTALWPTLRTRAAMSIGAAVDLQDVDFNDIVREAGRWHLPEHSARTRVIHTLEKLHEAVHQVDAPDHEKAEQCLALIRERSAKLLEGSSR